MKTLPLLLAALMSVGIAGCERHPGQAERMGARAAGHGMRGERGGGHGGIRRACEADIEQFCAADQKGRDRRECLQSHMDKLSADCKAAIEARKNHRRGDKGGDKTGDGSE